MVQSYNLRLTVSTCELIVVVTMQPSSVADFVCVEVFSGGSFESWLQKVKTTTLCNVQMLLASSAFCRAKVDCNNVHAGVRHK